MLAKNLIDCEDSSKGVAFWETDKLAYVKKDVVDNIPVWAIYGSNGRRLGYAADRRVAFALIAHNNLVGVSVH